MTPPTEAELVEMAARAEKATPGPWDLEVNGRDGELFVTMDRTTIPFITYGTQATLDDEEFIAGEKLAAEALMVKPAAEAPAEEEVPL